MTEASRGWDRPDVDSEDFNPDFGPHAGRHVSGVPRTNPYSVEGYLDGMANFASSAGRARGWQRRVAVLVAWAVLIPLGIAVLIGVGRLFELLIWH